jgi:hypothetical protein
LRALWRDNSLSLVFLAFFVAALAGQAFAGWHAYNNEAVTHHQETITLGRYLVSSSFGNAVMENWQSEYLQFTLYILLTVWFVQKGSPESKQIDKQGTESEREQRVGAHAGPESPRGAHVRGVRGHAAELAVGVPRGRLDGGAGGLPAPARVAGVQAGRLAPRGHGDRGLAAPTIASCNGPMITERPA